MLKELTTKAKISAFIKKHFALLPLVVSDQLLETQLILFLLDYKPMLLYQRHREEITNRSLMPLEEFQLKKAFLDSGRDAVQQLLEQWLLTLECLQRTKKQRSALINKCQTKKVCHMSLQVS